MARPIILLVVPAALLANTASADFYSHRYGGVSVLNSNFSGFCPASRAFVNSLVSPTLQASPGDCTESTSSGWKIYGGWQWTEHWAVEADLRQAGEGELYFTMMSPRLPQLNVRDRLTTRMGNAFVVGHLPIGRSGISLFGKVGAGFWLNQLTEYQEGEALFTVLMSDGSTQGVAVPVSGKLKDNASGFHWGYGAGVSYRHHNSWTLRAEWEVFPDIGSEELRARYELETTSLGLSMHF
ncbi:outer membrane beta-barrel protein [Microbulbifer sp. SA54]|uniref:outer membrane beta-barrel protein n=1 Tax=Microbulbifer sp. SA54 TaxID=3401577 RepID=UPI003AAB91C5